MTMREKMAKYLCRLHFPEITDAALDNSATQHVWQEFLPDADAALAALEEPTKAMLQEGDANGPHAGAVWHAMLRAATKP